MKTNEIGAHIAWSYRIGRFSYNCIRRWRWRNCRL